MASPPAMLSPHHSPSPPPQPAVSQPISKRDKRRTMISNSLSDLSATFNQNKDEHYRTKLSIINAEIRAITEANCYTDDGSLLPDSGEEIEAALTELLRMSGVGLGPNSERPGKYYKKFVEQVNDAAVTRDVGLSEIHNNNTRYAKMISLQHSLSTYNANAEYDHLLGTIRTRLLNRLSQARKRLISEKDHLETSDTSLNFLHPTTQYTIINSDRSPGGRQHITDIFSSLNNPPTRKLRGRKGEETMSDAFTGGGSFMAALANLEGAGILNGSSLAAGAMSPGGPNGGKRKRGAKSIREDDFFTSRKGTSTPPTPNDHGDLTAEQKTALAANEFIKPLYSLDRLFTDKELNAASTLAAQATTKHYTELHIQRNAADGIHLINPNAKSGDDGSNDEDTIMEDEPQHTTRNTTTAAANVPETAGSLMTAPVLPHTFLNQRLNAPTPAGLRQEDAQADLAEIKRLISGEPAAPGRVAGSSASSIVNGHGSAIRHEGKRGGARDTDDEGGGGGKKSAHSGLGIPGLAAEERKKARRN